MSAAAPTIDVLDAGAPVRVHRRVHLRPAANIGRLTRYQGGMYSPTVERIAFTDGTSARTDLIRLNPGISAYSLDFYGIAPTRPSCYRIADWTAVRHLRGAGRAGEVQVDWILRNSLPQLTTVELSRRLREAGYLLGCANITEHEAIAGSQAAIWRLTNGLELDTRARTDPVRIRRDRDGVTVEFADALELGGYSLELVASAPVTVALYQSDDGHSWREVGSSRIAVGAGRHRKALGVGATVGGHRYYRIAVAATRTPATIGDVDFWLHGASRYVNAERTVALYRYLLAGAAQASTLTPNVQQSAATAADGLVGPMRLEVADSAMLRAEGAQLLDADGVELSGPVAPNGVFYLRPHPGATCARLQVSVPGTENGYGGMVLTGISANDSGPMFTPVALAVPTALVVDFDVSWSLQGPPTGAGPSNTASRATASPAARRSIRQPVR